MPLQSLTGNDLELILPWRNAPAVRQAMYSHHEINLDEHRAWFQRLQQDRSRRWYLFHDDTGTAQGVVYFTEIDAEQGTAFWGFYARPEAPSGTGLQMEFEALELAFNELALHKLNCEVLASNSAVVNMHKKIGFTEEGRFREQHYDGSNRIDIVRLGLLASDWSEHRERLRTRISQLKALKNPPPRRRVQYPDALR